MTAQRTAELAAHLDVAPKEVAAAVTLLRSGRADLIAAVVDRRRRMTVRAAPTAARAGEGA